MKYLFDPDGGELAPAKYNTPIEFIPNLILRVAEIFHDLSDLKPADREFCYCITVNPMYKKTIESMLNDIIDIKLPSGVFIYEVDGKRLFEFRGASGGIVHSLGFYIVTRNV